MSESTPGACLIFVTFRNFNIPEERSFEEWTSILHLSTRWGFTSIRDLAIRCLEPPTPLRRLILARRYAIEEWVTPALMELCERPEPLSLDEARQMDFEDVVLVGSVRQNVRSPTLTTNGAGIGDCIQAWRSGEPWSPGPAALSPSRPGTPVSSSSSSVASRPSTPGTPVASQAPTRGTVVGLGRSSGPTSGAFGSLFTMRPPSSSGFNGFGTASTTVSSISFQGGSPVSETIPSKPKKVKKKKGQ